MPSRALIVDSVKPRAELLRQELEQSGFAVSMFDGELFGAGEAEDWLVLAPLALPAPALAETPYAVYSSVAFCKNAELVAVACVARPFPWHVLSEITATAAGAGASLCDEQFYDVCRLSLLGEVNSATRFEPFVSGVCRAFRVSGCSLSTGKNAGTFAVSHLDLTQRDRKELAAANRLAARAQITTVAVLSDAKQLISILSWPLQAKKRDGYLAPFELGWRTFSRSESRALRALGDRVAEEVALLHTTGDSIAPPQEDSAGWSLFPPTFVGPTPIDLPGRPRKKPALTAELMAKPFGGIYQVQRRISSGAMGTVYQGEDTSLHRPVAIKILRPELAGEDVHNLQLQEEARLLASVRHPNMVQVYACNVEEEVAYFVMEYVDGIPLSDLIERATPEERIEVSVIYAVVDEIADALDAIHSLGIVHRDVKPQNILLDRINGRAVLVDVGIARRKDDAATVAGTPGFTAPECFVAGTGTAATDVYGLAATCYAMLTGDSPFVGYSPIHVLYQQRSGELRPVSQTRPELSTAVDDVLARALQPEPGERFSSALAFAIAFNKALSRPLRDTP